VQAKTSEAYITAEQEQKKSDQATAEEQENEPNLLAESQTLAGKLPLIFIFCEFLIFLLSLFILSNTFVIFRD
jgi:hypothetical protein